MGKLLERPTNGTFDVYEYTLKNDNIEIKFLNAGGSITDILMKDKDGNIENIVLKHKNLDNYVEAKPAYIGAIVGRVAGRVPYSETHVNGEKIVVSENNNGHSLHGGVNGFSMKEWAVKELSQNSYELTYTSNDGEEGYPGNLSVTVTYTLDGDDFIIDYKGRTDADTLINLTNHAYFNLSGGKDLAMSHDLYLNSTHFLETDENLMATGNLAEIKNTFIDFTTEKNIGRDFPENGYDNCTILNDARNINDIVATLSHKPSGRSIEVFTDQPALVLYTDGSAQGEELITGNHEKFLGICMETQFPNICANGRYTEEITYSPDNIYTQHTVYRFKTIN